MDGRTMSNRAWMPLHIENYLADTGHLTAAEHGAYMLLIMTYWRDGGLPEDERLIARIARLSKDEWAESRERILPLFEVDASGYAAFERAQGLDRKRKIPNRLRKAVYERDGRKCRYCATETGPFHIDHIFPWSRGGRHELDNLCVACVSCNAIKGALTGDEFRSALQ
jgi:hypothetical protein